MRWIMLRLGQLAATIVPAPQAQGDTARAETHMETLLVSVSGVTGWITMVGGAFLISLCFLVSFIAADGWMSRQPMSLQSICSNVLELYESRGEITYNEKWQQELSRLRDDCAVALYKYEPTSTKYGLTSTR
jgi:hypothetical protein